MISHTDDIHNLLLQGEADNARKTGELLMSIFKPKIKREMKIKLHQSKNNQYYFTILAGNNKVIATSETYKTLRNCLKTAKKFKMKIID